MGIALSVIAILATAAFAAFSYFDVNGHKELAFWCFITGLVMSAFGGILSIIYFAHNWHARRFTRRPSTDSPPLPQTSAPQSTRSEKFRFGVYWDSDLNPLCPVCKTPLTLSRDKLIYRIDGGVPLPLPEPHCFNCDKLLSLHDDDGNHLTLSEAKKLLPTKTSKAEIESPNPQPLQLQTPDTPESPEPDTYQPDDKDKEIIRYLYKEGVDHLLSYIAKFAELDRQETTLRLNKLISNKYVRRPHTSHSRPFAAYRLTDKGIQFAIDNNLRSEQNPKEPEAKIEPIALPDAQSQPPDTFTLDKTAIDILKQIDKQVVQESEFSRVLKLEPAQVRNSLTLLEQHNYICLQRPSERAPFYLLTEKGSNQLDKPIRTVPFPNSDLDETSIKILLILANPTEHSTYTSSIAERLKLSKTRVEFYLGELHKQGYCYADNRSFTRPDFHRLTQQGKKISH